MLQVKVSTGKGMNKVSGMVVVHGFDTLTPKAARAALEIAGYFTGTVESVTIPDGSHEHRVAYRVYKTTARKLYDEMYYYPQWKNSPAARKTLRELLVNGLEYSSTWGIWALKQDGKFVPDSLARFGQFAFENGGMKDEYELVGSNSYLEDMITKQTDDDENPVEREEAVNNLFAYGMLDN
jgi:hypothetical protein